MHETDSSMPYHGGDLHWAERRFGRPPAGWIDLSTGINPWAYPLPAIPPEAWARLPDAAAMDRLLSIAAQHYRAPGHQTLAAAPGTQSLIRLLPTLRAAGRVAVVGPTYGEHAASWCDAGHRAIECADPDEAAAHADIVIVTNPNNPDGRRFDPGMLSRIADRLAARDGLLIVDEAFADLSPSLSLANTADRPGRLVLRSFGKFYGLAGLRLGFAIAEPKLTGRIKKALGAWPIGGPALEVGATALADRAWTQKTRTHLARAGEALRQQMQSAGLEIVGGTDLFVLGRHQDAATLFQRLGRAGIFVRHFPERPDQLRFGLPPDPESEVRLTAALMDC